jgi:hypothetical protein
MPIDVGSQKIQSRSKLLLSGQNPLLEFADS